MLFVQLLAFAIFFGNSDSEKIDRLISKLDNSQFDYSIQYVGMSFRLNSIEADSLAAISQYIDSKGKRINKDLVNAKLKACLTDTTKGVAVHFLLTRINGGCWSYCIKHTTGNKYEYNRLEVYWNSRDVISSTLTALEDIQKEWEGRLK